jgi:predicted DNA-binding protein with PD1-like motif
VIRKIELHNFRGVLDGAVELATPLTLLVGPNGSGKSSVLDAILLASNESHHRGMESITERRHSDGREERWTVHGGEGHAQIRLTTDILTREVTVTAGMGRVSIDSASKGFLRKLFTQPIPSSDKFELPSPVHLVEPYMSAKSSLADTYTLAAEQGRRAEVEALVAELVPDVKHVEIMSRGGKATVYLTYADASRPAALAGDGVQLLLKMGLELASLSGGVALLEEPETHLHPAAIGIAAKTSLVAMRRGVQIIATTHSIDMIDAIVAGATASDLNKLSLCRLRLTDGQLACSCLSGPDVAFSRSDIQDDLR